jgi:U4/U6.U5 tri-snRNP component SNU23
VPRAFYELHPKTPDVCNIGLFEFFEDNKKMAAKPQGKADNFRRTWDTEEYEKLAKERLDNEGEEPATKRSNVPIKRELLKPREHEVDLDSTLGKSVVITKSTPTSQQGGYFCNVCDCIVKDSINFLDHINGKKHQRNLGMSMRVERSSLDQVKKRFETNKRKQEEEKKKKDYDFEARMTELKEEVSIVRIILSRVKWKGVQHPVLFL